MEKRVKRSQYSLSKRLRVTYILLIIALVYLIGRLILLQVFDSNGKVAAQVDQLVDEVEITAQRGNIYDRNMNTLVYDSSAKSVNIIPSQIQDQEKVVTVLSQTLGVKPEEITAKANQLEDDRVQISDNTIGKNVESWISSLSSPEAYLKEDNALYVYPNKVKDADKDSTIIASKFEIDEKAVKENLTSKENSPVVIKTKVDNNVAEQILKQTQVEEIDSDVSDNGIELLEDKKRYYTNGNFMSYILGFTGNDHEGLYGVEKTFDDQLAGTPGIVYYQKDAKGKIINSQTKTLQEAQKGEDLVLSVDSNIQSATEKYLTNAINSSQAKGGTAIVMSVKTGEILAMASKPDYDLNNPYSVSEDFKAKYSEDLDGLSEEQQEELMWKNPAVSFIYEPGSTFKPITVSIALEEGAINPSMHFECTGSINIDGVTINCTGTHGTQTIADTLENSCNPGLVQIISNVDPNLFYQYVYNYGFGEPTGIELTGEESGIVNRVFDEDGSYKMIDYTTFSFGQGLATTPIQLISALNALINNGYYEKPTILKDSSTESNRQIISTSTSSTLRTEMQGVLEANPLLKQQAAGFSMGGKTGTAEKFINGQYDSSQYVTSFFCFSPVEDPQYCCLVVLDSPKYNTSGAASAAPAAIEILKQTLLNTGSNPSESKKAEILVPSLIGENKDKAEEILKERGIKYEIENKDAGEIVINQSIPAQTVYAADQILTLSLGNKQNEDSTVMPDFTGMSVQSVNEKVKEMGLDLQVQGSGFAVNQSIAPGQTVTKDMKITVEFK